MDTIPSFVKYIDINLNAEDSKFVSTSYFNCNYELNLNKNYSEIKKKYSENTRRNIKKANHHGLILSKAFYLEEIIEIFKNNKGKEISNLNYPYYALLKKILTVCLEEKILESYVVRDKNNEILAGAFFIKNKKRYTFIFSGRTEKAKENGAMFFLIDAFIHEKSFTDCILDFDGSNDLNVARFYKSFGAENIPYCSYKINKLPWPLNIIKR